MRQDLRYFDLFRNLIEGRGEEKEEWKEKVRGKNQLEKALYLPQMEMSLQEKIQIKKEREGERKGQEGNLSSLERI